MNSDILPFRFEGNWKTAPGLSREFLADGLGADLESVAMRICEVFSEEADDEDESAPRVYSDAKYPRRKGQLAAFVVVSEENPGHQVGTTIYLRRKGEDMFVRLAATARTSLKWLHWMIRGMLVAGLFLFFYGLYFQKTGQSHSLLLEYARKQSPTDPGIFLEAIKSGYRYDSASGDFVRMAEPMDIIDVLREDPKLFLMHISGPPAIILAAIWVLVAFIPPSTFDFVSKLVGWPSVADFNGYVNSEVAGVDAGLRRILEKDFGVRTITQF